MKIKSLLQRFLSDDVLYFISYGIFLITSLLSTSFYYRLFIGYPYSWIQVACLALLIFREYRLGAAKQNWVTLAVLTVMAALSLQYTMGNLTRLVPLMFFYIYGARNIHFTRIARFSLWVSGIVVCFASTSKQATASALAYRNAFRCRLQAKTPNSSCVSANPNAKSNSKLNRAIRSS